MRAFDLSPLFRSSVGFDRFDKLFETAFGESAREVGYPPYNIVKLGKDDYRVTLAVAGFSQDDIDITVHDNQLIVRGQVKNPEKDVEYLYRGIGQRAFEHRFQLADHVQVVDARLVNGLLDVSLRREVPEELKPRKIAISNGSGATTPQVIEAEASKAA